MRIIPFLVVGLLTQQFLPLPTQRFLVTPYSLCQILASEVFLIAHAFLNSLRKTQFSLNVFSPRDLAREDRVVHVALNLVF